MKRRNLLFAGVASSALLLSCGVPSQPDRRQVNLQDANTVDYILIEKGARRLTTYSQGVKVKTYRIDLGFNPIGHKQYEGDGRTPEGRYYITFKNPNSQYHLSVYINYPNAQDKARAAARGLKPGGEIFIHGGPNRPEDMNKRDWTAGCISVTDAEVTEIYRQTKLGAIVDLKP